MATLPLDALSSTAALRSAGAGVDVCELETKGKVHLLTEADATFYMQVAGFRLSLIQINDRPALLSHPYKKK